jgi:hypothetical protein
VRALALLALLAMPGCARKEAATSPTAAADNATAVDPAAGAPAPPQEEAEGDTAPPQDKTEGAAPGAPTESAATAPGAPQAAPPPTAPRVPVTTGAPPPATPGPRAPTAPGPRAPTAPRVPVTTGAPPPATPGPRAPTIRGPQPSTEDSDAPGEVGHTGKPGAIEAGDSRAPQPRPGRPEDEQPAPPSSPVPPPRLEDQQAPATPEPEDPAPEARDVRDDVEDFYASLSEEAIAFHVPKTVPRGQVFVVRLIVEPGKSEAELARVLVEAVRDAGPGEVRTRTARLGDEMQAHLSSPTLQIVVRGTDTQLVRRSGVTEWVWDVTASTGGMHRLALTLYAIPRGRGSGIKVKTFEETLSVEVAFVDEVKETLSANWEWMWTFVLGPLGAVVWRKRRQKLARAS